MGVLDFANIEYGMRDSEEGSFGRLGLWDFGTLVGDKRRRTRRDRRRRDGEVEAQAWRKVDETRSVRWVPDRIRGSGGVARRAGKGEEVGEMVMTMIFRGTRSRARLLESA